MRKLIFIILALLALICLPGCETYDLDNIHLGYTVTNGFRTRSSIQTFPSISIYVTGEIPEQCTVKIETEIGECLEKEIHPGKRISFTFDDNRFNNVGTYHLNLSLISPSGKTILSRNGISISMESKPITGIRLTVTPNGSESTVYKEGECAVLAPGTNGQFYISVLPVDVAAYISIKTIPATGTPIVKIPDSGTESFNGTITVPYSVEQEGSDAIQVQTSENGLIKTYFFDIDVRKEVTPLPVPVIIVSEINDIAFVSDKIVIKGQISNYSQSDYSFIVRIDEIPSEGKIDANGDFLIEVPTEGMKAGRHLASVELVETISQTTRARKLIPFDLLDFTPRLFEQPAGTENWNLNAQIGVGKSYVLKIETGAAASLNTVLRNSLNHKTVAGRASQDGKDYSFTLTDNILSVGPQGLVITFSRNDVAVADKTVVVTGWNSFKCKYSLEGGTVYAQLSGPSNRFGFQVHFSVSIYLKAVIPYTEAITIGSQNYNKEEYVYTDIESMGITFDYGSNEIFSKREIYSSSYLKYAKTYLEKELKKIKATHQSTRWVNGRKESYWPEPYLQADIIFSHQKNDGTSFPDYFEIMYDDNAVKTALKEYGLETKTYVVE